MVSDWSIRWRRSSPATAMTLHNTSTYAQLQLLNNWGLPKTVDWFMGVVAEIGLEWQHFFIFFVWAAFWVCTLRSCAEQGPDAGSIRSLIKILQDKWFIIKACKKKRKKRKKKRMSTLSPYSLCWLHSLGSERAALSLPFLSLQLWSLISTPFTFSLKITFFSHYQADRFVLLRSLVPLFCPRFGPSVNKVVIPLVRGAELLSVWRLWSGRWWPNRAH